METVLMDKNYIFTDDKSLKMPEGFISSDEYEEKLAEEDRLQFKKKQEKCIQNSNLSSCAGNLEFLRKNLQEKCR